MWKLQPTPHPPLFPSNPSLKVEVLSSAPLFENLVGGSTPPPPCRRGEGVHTMLKKEYKVELNTEAVARSYAVKKVFLKNSGKSQENTCARVGFLMKLEEVTPGAYLIMNL